jgi:hypothetical protein
MDTAARETPTSSTTTAILINWRLMWGMLGVQTTILVDVHAHDGGPSQ